MNRIEALWEWLRGQQKSVRNATYEELFSSEYSTEEAYSELTRRLKPIIRAMAHYDNPQTAEQTTNSIFVEFTQQFPGAPPEAGLRRLASVIRSRIGPTAFYVRGQAQVYYTQLALYHIADARLRQCLEFTFQRGMNRHPDLTLTEELARELQVSTDEAEEVSRLAWRELCSVMKDFQAGGWNGWSEGILPLSCPEGERL